MRVFGTKNEKIIAFAEYVAAKLEIDAYPVDILFEHESITGSDFGYTSGSTDYAEVTIFRRIYGSKIDMEEMLQTIAHELVHAKQFLTGRLSLESMDYQWEGKKYNNENSISSPWEIEATDLGEKLYNSHS
jgi:hypothetical protein